MLTRRDFGPLEYVSKWSILFQLFDSFCIRRWCYRGKLAERGFESLLWESERIGKQAITGELLVIFLRTFFFSFSDLQLFFAFGLSSFAASMATKAWTDFALRMQGQCQLCTAWLRFGRLYFGRTRREAADCKGASQERCEGIFRTSHVCRLGLVFTCGTFWKRWVVDTVRKARGKAQNGLPPTNSQAREESGFEVEVKSVSLVVHCWGYYSPLHFVVTVRVVRVSFVYF